MQLHATASRPRLLGIDIARSIAILAALGAHAAAVFHLQPGFEPAAWTATQMFMRLGTPSFIFLFGCMLEIVYVRQFRDGNSFEITRRLYTRSIQCYLFFVATSFAAMLGDYYGPGRFIASIAYLYNGFLGNVLKFYTIALILAPLIIMLRLRYGLQSLLLLTVSLWVFHFLAKSIELPMLLEQTKIIPSVLGTFFAIGDDGFSPAYTDAFTFVFAGMATASAMLRIAAGERLDGGLSLGFVLAVVVVLLVLLASRYGDDVVADFTDVTLRQLDHPLYFLIGICGAFLVLALSFVCAAAVGHSAAQQFGTIGRHSLFAFSFGNILLNLWPGTYGTTRFVECTLFFVITIAVVYYVDEVERRARANSALSPLNRTIIAARRLGAEQTRHLADIARRRGAGLAHRLVRREAYHRRR